MNDQMALGAVEALKGANRTDVYVTGVDATLDACYAVRDGDMLMSCFQDGAALAEESLNLAVKLAKGEDAESVYIDFVPVTTDNVEEYIALRESETE